ncbi:hypothetical protein ASE63_22275 [Bosea sp. Root381]|uniref:hypothetical protein n=1 Tax=Bosea sp. Root381 TaxID=1736524 RepID=UPI0006F7F47D|nr:hypothetical protein [Bosea sp. Root381]KRE07429.1 hypothetical protein ASE63_22275 [Bosea sp. Root381]
MPSAEGIVARFQLHYRCHNCERNVFKTLDVPDVDDAPRDIDELSDSAFLAQQRYWCTPCQSAIGTIVAIKQLPIDEEIAA